MPKQSKGFSARINSAVHPDELAAAEMVAEQQHISLSELMRRALSEYLTARGQ